MVKWLLVTMLIAVLMVWMPPSGFSWEHRLDNDGYERVSELLPSIVASSNEAGVPVWLLVGLIYNESNARSRVIGDNGRAFGLGQIHCGSGGFSWFNFLGEHGYTRCRDLLMAKKNIVAISIILIYLKSKMRNPDDYLLLVTYYHKGENYKRLGKKKSRGYYERVKWFGRKILEREYQLCLQEI